MICCRGTGQNTRPDRTLTRVAGLALVIIKGVFLVYTFTAHLLPGILAVRNPYTWQRFFGHHDGMPCPVLLLLFGKDDVRVMLQGCLYSLSLMANDDDEFFNAGIPNCIHDILDQHLATDFVQNFRGVRLHAGALASGKNHGGGASHE